MKKSPWRRHRPLFTSPVPKEVRKPKIKWRVLPILWSAIKRTCTVLGALMLISMIVVIFSARQVAQVTQKQVPALPKEMVLYMEFDEGFREVPKPASFAEPFAIGKPTIRQFVDTLDRAAADERVKGILARLKGGRFSLAHIQEIRAALRRFQESGKFAHIYATSYDSLGGYYLASSFDQIWMQPMGIVSITGMNAEVPFFRGTMDKIGLSPQFFQRKEYKTAYESLTNTEISPENKEMMERLVDDIRASLMSDIPSDRDLSEAQFENLIDKGLFTAEEASQAKLIDRNNYIDILVGDIREAFTGKRDSDDPLFVPLKRYMAEALKANIIEQQILSHKPKVALVYAVGAIMPTNVSSGAGIAAADEIAPAILEAADDKRVEAIVLRIDSPGGSPTASESILRAIERAQQKDKPVIVSMGSSAASGGYWIASYADRIFALPTTVTGSIGVVGGKFTAQALWTKLGVNWERIRWGENSGLWSLNTPFSPSEAERMNAMLDQVYDGFIARVAKGRGLTPNQVDRIAGGRVWLGSRAAQVGLVDELGGLNEAMNYTASLLEVETKDDLNIVVLPKPKTAFEQFVALLSQQGQIYDGLRFQGAVMSFLEPLAKQVALIKNPELYTTYEPLTID